MKVSNHKDYIFFTYISKKSSLYSLGDIVINKENEIGVIIQIHEEQEFRTDMFGNCSASEIRLANEDEIRKYRFDLYRAIQPITEVVFRKWKDNGIIALFPYEVDYPNGDISSYMHVGQHGAANYYFMIQETVPATEVEYNDLKKELESIGYNLKVIKRKSNNR